MSTKTPECFKPSVPLLAKLGSILAHVQEARSGDGCNTDWLAAEIGMQDNEVKAWLEQMDALSLLPKKRRAP